MNRAFSYWKTIIWSVIMLIIFLLPANNLSKAPSVSGLSEFIHMFMFAVLTWSIIRERQVRASVKIPGSQVYISAIIFSLLFGVAIELLQKLSGFGRTAELMDVVFDLAGSLIAVSFIQLYFRKVRHKYFKS